MLPRPRSILIWCSVVAAWYVGFLGRGCYRQLQAGAKQWSLNEELENAALQGKYAEVRRLLHAGANANYSGDGSRGGVLNNAWQSGDQKTLAAVMDAHPSLSGPLIDAAFGGDSEFVRFLLHHGADPNTREGNESAIEIARRMGHTDAVETLKRAGAQD